MLCSIMQALLNYRKCKACTDILQLNIVYLLMQSVLNQFWKQARLIKMFQIMQKNILGIYA